MTPSVICGWLVGVLWGQLNLFHVPAAWPWVTLVEQRPRNVINATITSSLKPSNIYQMRAKNILSWEFTECTPESPPINNIMWVTWRHHDSVTWFMSHDTVESSYSVLFYIKTWPDNFKLLLTRHLQQMQLSKIPAAWTVHKRQNFTFGIISKFIGGPTLECVIWLLVDTH